ncbi:MAG: twin-arginine translocase TatA/TatE family subunit [Terracidiphilus sp.]
MGIHPTIDAATLGMWDTMIVMIMALVVFGPRRLPKIGRQIGKLMYEFRKASNDFRFQMEEELRNAEEADRRQREEAERQRALTAAPAQTPAQIEAPPPAAELPAVSAAEQTDEYAASENTDDYRSSYDEAAYEHYQREAPETENEPDNAPEPAGLSVKPPASGAPVPAERPTSRASAAPATAVDATPEVESAADTEISEFLPSGDEAALCHANDTSAEMPPAQILPVSEAATETEPAAHHG